MGGGDLILGFWGRTFADSFFYVDGLLLIRLSKYSMVGYWFLTHTAHDRHPASDAPFTTSMS